MTDDTNAHRSGDAADAPDEHPAVLSPGDSDAPDAPDAQTVYPDDQGVPGEPADE